jgi:hypothetical protein
MLDARFRSDWSGLAWIGRRRTELAGPTFIFYRATPTGRRPAQALAAFVPTLVTVPG